MTVIPFDLDELHDRFIAADRAWRAEPTAERRATAETAYLMFYRRFNRSSTGADQALAELRARMSAAVARVAA